jgi:hypothetical protein
VWLGAGADPKVAQRVLGQATAAMTMDLYGHLVDEHLWQAAQLVGGISAARATRLKFRRLEGRRKCLVVTGFRAEPPIGIEPMTYALRGGLGMSGNVHGMTSTQLLRLLGPAVATSIHPRC